MYSIYFVQKTVFKPLFNNQVLRKHTAEIFPLGNQDSKQFPPLKGLRGVAGVRELAMGSPGTKDTRSLPAGGGGGAAGRARQALGGRRPWEGAGQGTPQRHLLTRAGQPQEPGGSSLPDHGLRIPQRGRRVWTGTRLPHAACPADEPGRLSHLQVGLPPSRTAPLAPGRPHVLCCPSGSRTPPLLNLGRGLRGIHQDTVLSLPVPPVPPPCPRGARRARTPPSGRAAEGTATAWASWRASPCRGGRPRTQRGSRPSCGCQADTGTASAGVPG